MRPRHYLLALTAAAALPFTAAAETHYKPRITLGARAGMSLGRTSFSPSVRQGWVTGSTGAVTFSYTEEKLFGLVAELGWITRGWSENFTDPYAAPNPLRYSRSLTYLRLPLLTHIYVGPPRFKAFVNLGPEIGYMLGSSISSNFDYRNPTADPNWPVRNRMTEQLTMDITGRFDYGISAGAGGEFFLTPSQSITIEARYYFGLGNIFPSSKADIFSASRPSSIEVTLGYNFRVR